MKWPVVLLCSSVAAYLTCAHALEFTVPPAGDDLVGHLNVVAADKGDTLQQIGSRYGIGYSEMVAANSEWSANAPLKAGSEVILPTLYLLPQLRTGVVVNLAELRLYYFPVRQDKVYTYPLAAGQQGWNTPLASTTVVRKAANPSWTVPASILAESARKGKKLKPFYDGDDPENPLGHYALYLNVEGIRVHGTMASRSIGRRASHGCLRLWDNDIQALYENVPLGTPFVIEHQEAKAGWHDHALYLQVDSPFKEYHNANAVQTAINQATANHVATIDWQRVHDVQEAQEGIPTPIGYDQTLKALPEGALPFA